MTRSQNISKLILSAALLAVIGWLIVDYSGNVQLQIASLLFGFVIILLLRYMP